MKKILILILVVIVFWAAWYLGGPLFYNTTVDESMSAEMNEPALFQGEFMDADRFHKGSGLAKIFTDNDGAVLRFEDFRVTNGPALVVLLSENANPKSSQDFGDYVELGDLKGNIGNQNYDIPSDIDLGKYESVVIYCKPFNVIFSVAELQ